MDSIGTLNRKSLQYGVQQDALVRKCAPQRFEPSGYTRNPNIRTASSIIDYVFRWMAIEFIPGYREASNPNRAQAELPMPDLETEMKKKLNRPVSDLPPIGDAPLLAAQRSNGGSNGHGRSPVMTTLSATIAHFQMDAPTCPSCGHVAVRNGACYKCLNCGESLGCS
jgi:ribonucleoside-diphosphate reductase alpha chain